MPRVSASLVALSLALSCAYACGDDPVERPEQVVFGGERWVQLSVPRDYDHSKKTPLLVVLHGYGVNADVILAHTRLRNLNRDENVLVVAPDGIEGSDGSPSWNIEGTCCDKHDTDDVAYIVGLVEEISAVYNVDPERVYAFGHSNGGLMVYHLACERPDIFKGIVSLAGPTVGATCQPSEAVSILHIHGDQDEDVRYEGGTFSTGLPYLGAVAGLDTWADHNGCGDNWQDGANLDIDVDAPGAETTVSANESCPNDIGLELWTIKGIGHVPGFQESFPGEVFRWLEAH